MRNPVPGEMEAMTVRPDTDTPASSNGQDDLTEPQCFAGTMGSSADPFPPPFGRSSGLPARYYRRIRPGYWLLALVLSVGAWYAIAALL